MITTRIKRYCKEYWKIENYEKAVNDNSQIWEVHHRLEIMPFSGKIVASKYLIEQNMYYNVKPEELIFLTKSEHTRLDRPHNTRTFSGKHHTSESIEKIRNSNKGKKRSEETKINISKAKKGKPTWNKNKSNVKIIGRHWYTNGIEDRTFFEENVPEGWVRGRCKTKGRKQSDAEKQKRREAALKRTDYHKFHLTDEQKQKLSWAKKEYYGSLK